MDVTQLRTLVHVAELGSLSKAADRLCTAQPALSRHVRLLEEELGTRLFDRHGRGMILTEQGRTVLLHAKRIMAEFEDIRSHVAEENGTVGGRVSIGMPPTVAEILAVPIVEAIRKSHPSATCRIVSAYSLYLFDWVHRGEVDVAILYDPRSIKSLKSEPLVEEELHLIAPKDAGLSLDTPFAFRELADKPLILPSGDHSLRQIIERSADACGIKLDVRIEADSYSTLKQLVLNGLGWTILPVVPFRADIDSGRLSSAPIIDPVPRRLLELSVSADRPLSRLGSVVLETMEATTSALVKRGAWPGKMRLK